jgi:hypothetical protein
MKTPVLAALLLASFLSIHASRADTFEEADLIELGINPDQVVEVGQTDLTQAVPADRDEDEEVKDTHLKLAGRGFMNRNTHESLALACVGKTENSTEISCDQLRFVYFNPVSQKAFYLGHTMIVDQYVSTRKANRMNGDQKRQYAIKQIMKNFKRWRGQNKGLSENTKQAITMGGFMGVLVLEWLASSVATGGLSIALTAATYPFYLVLTPIITGDIKLMNGNQRIESASFDQNGWNWSSDPAQIKPKVFNLLIDYFSTSQNTPQTNPIRAGVSP